MYFIIYLFINITITSYVIPVITLNTVQLERGSMFYSNIMTIFFLKAHNQDLSKITITVIPFSFLFLKRVSLSQANKVQKKINGEPTTISSWANKNTVAKTAAFDLVTSKLLLLIWLCILYWSDCTGGFVIVVFNNYIL